MKEEISLCIIVKNEEKNLNKFLNNLKDFADEIIIADTGSTDETKKIAKRFTDKVFDYGWNDDFSDARNFSISKATRKWILVLDPDEKITKKGLIRIKEIISNNKDKGILGYRLIQKTYYQGKIISIRGICRLFKNKKGIEFVYPIHETVRESIKELKGRIGKTGIIIKHYPRVNKKKQEYYLRLLKIKKKQFPGSNANKEIENEYKLFSPH